MNLSRREFLKKLPGRRRGAWAHLGSAGGLQHPGKHSINTVAGSWGTPSQPR